MKPPLLMALAAVLGATLYLNTQEDEGVDLVKAGDRPARSADTAAAPTDRGPRATQAQVRPGQSGAAAASALPADRQAWVEASLKQGLDGWQARQADAKLPPQRPMGSAVATAWAAQLPPPPPAPPKPRPLVGPAQPVAPAFPHQWVGNYNDLPAGPTVGKPADKPIQRAILVGPAQTWVVKPGDVIEGQWRVDSIQNRTLQLTYLPLMVARTVAMK